MSEAMQIEARAAKSKTRVGVQRPGQSKLSRAADKVLVKKGEEIAESLAEQAAKGNVQSTRLLLELAEGSEEKPAAQSKLTRLVEQWSGEAEWPAE